MHSELMPFIRCWSSKYLKDYSSQNLSQHHASTSAPFHFLLDDTKNEVPYFNSPHGYALVTEAHTLIHLQWIS